jgi:hypothetical protein
VGGYAPRVRESSVRPRRLVALLGGPSASPLGGGTGLYDWRLRVGLDCGHRVLRSIDFCSTGPTLFRGSTHAHGGARNRGSHSRLRIFVAWLPAVPCLLTHALGYIVSFGCHWLPIQVSVSSFFSARCSEWSDGSGRGELCATAASKQSLEGSVKAGC